MQETEHYKLKKPAAEDFYRIGDQNENADVIDAALNDLETGKEGLLKSAATKAALVDTDSMPLVDSADAAKTKRVLWSQIKATLKTWFDSLYAAVGHSHTWSAITGKPSSFVPDTHAATHKTGGADPLTAADVGARPGTWTPAWGDVTGKPSSFTPSTHNHTKSQITDFPSTMPPSAHTHGSITNDGKIGSTADLPVFTGTGGVLGTKTAEAARDSLGADPAAKGITSGTATALTLAQTGFTLADGACVRCRLHVSPTAPTLNVNGTGAKPVVTSRGKPLNDAVAGSWVTVIYSSALGSFILQGEGGGNTRPAGRGKAFDGLMGYTVLYRKEPK